MTEQELFENKVFAQYFISTIKRNPNAGKGISGAMDFISEDCKNKNEFLAKNEDGTYQLDTLNSAWWGWQECLKITRDNK